MEIELFLGLCVLSGVAYRLGGCALNLPFKSKIRDWGVPLIGVIILCAMIPKDSLWGFWGALGVFFIASWGSLCTYWDHWSSSGVEWYEWVLTGFFYGLAGLPIALSTGSWFGFIARTIILMLFMPFSNKLQFKVCLDKTDGVEFSRGFMFTATLPLLVI